MPFTDLAWVCVQAQIMCKDITEGQMSGTCDGVWSANLEEALALGCLLLLESEAGFREGSATLAAFCITHTSCSQHGTYETQK